MGKDTGALPDTKRGCTGTLPPRRLWRNDRQRYHRRSCSRTQQRRVRQRQRAYYRPGVLVALEALVEYTHSWWSDLSPALAAPRRAGFSVLRPRLSAANWSDLPAGPAAGPESAGVAPQGCAGSDESRTVRTRVAGELVVFDATWTQVLTGAACTARLPGPLPTREPASAGELVDDAEMSNLAVARSLTDAEFTGLFAGEGEIDPTLSRCPPGGRGPSTPVQEPRALLPQLVWSDVPVERHPCRPCVRGPARP